MQGHNDLISCVNLATIMKGLFSIILFLSFSSELVFSQENGAMAIVNALNSTTNQWLCSSFQSEYPQFFENETCPPQLDFSSLTAEHESYFESIPANQAAEKLISLALLREDCDRFIHLKALGEIYFPIIDSALNANSLPLSFRYLPAALSGFNPAYHNGKGLGFWQLGRLESLRYGIEVNDSIDYRYNLTYSTLCSAIRLQDLKSKLRFDEAVMCALLEGVKPVRERLEHCNYQLTEFIQASPPSSLEWISGYKSLCSYFEHLITPSTKSEYLQVLSQYSKVNPNQSAQFEAYASVLDITISDLKNLNPGLRSDRIPAKFPVLLPSELALKFESLEDSIYAFEARQAILEAKRIEEEKRRLAEIQKQEEIIHTVRSGEVLGLIAQRYKVSINDIKSWNNIKRDMIYVGQKLSIQTKEKPQPKAEAEPQSQANTSSNPKEIIYTVKSGDSLWVIAQQFPGVSAEDIMKWNDIDSDLSPGQELKILKGE